MKKILALTAAVLLTASTAMAAGTVTTTEITHTSVKKVSFAFTTAAGSADATTTGSYTGMLERVTIDYVDCTNLYDVVVNDADGFDVLVGNGQNLGTADAQKDNVSDGLGAMVNSTLTLAVTNCTGAQTGTINLYIR